MSIEKFETLMVLLLAKEISPEEEKNLYQIIDSSEIYRKRYCEYVETQNFLLSLSEESIAEISTLTEKPVVRAKNYLYTYLTAAAIFLVFFSSWFFFRIKEKKSFVDIHPIKIEGNCTNGNAEKLSIGSKINESRIVSGVLSVCDFQTEKFKSLVLRVGAESKLDILDEREKIVLNLMHGQLFLDEISKLSDNPTLINFGKIRIQLIGTKVSILTGPNENIQVDVLEGEVLIEQIDKQIKLTLRTGQSWKSTDGKNSPNDISHSNEITLKKEFATLRHLPKEFLESPERIRKFQEVQEEKSPTESVKSESKKGTEEIIQLVFKIIKKDGTSIVGKVKESSDEFILQNKDGIFKIPKSEVEKIESQE